MSTSTADLWDERGDTLQSCSLQLRHYGGRRVFSGTISTVRCHRDNALVKAALAEPGHGRVLVVDGGGSLESALMGDLIATEHLTESDEFARLAHEKLAAADSVPSRGVKQAPFFVLMGVQMPASLVEIGFITNARDERALGTSERQDEIARALARAVHEFGRRYDVRFETLADFRDPPADPAAREALLQQALRAYVARLEQLCREAPYNWFNFHDFWHEDAAH